MPRITSSGVRPVNILSPSSVMNGIVGSTMNAAALGGVSVQPVKIGDLGSVTKGNAQDLTKNANGGIGKTTSGTPAGPTGPTGNKNLGNSAPGGKNEIAV